jgi:creatinine amidohydrolase
MQNPPSPIETTVTIGWETFTNYCVDIGTSLAHHGFKRILFLNGHGSNIPLLDVASRLIGLRHPDVLAASTFYLSSPDGLRVIEEVRESERGGMGHACELETSIYLALDPDAVFMDKAVDENSYPEGPNAWMDWSDGPLKLMPWWNALSHTGVHGDATKATAEKGRVLLDAAVKECVDFVRELHEKPLPVRWEPRETPG